MNNTRKITPFIFRIWVWNDSNIRRNRVPGRADNGGAGAEMGG